MSKSPLKWADVAHHYVLSGIEGLQNWGPNSKHPKVPNPVLVTLDALRLSTIFDGVVEFTPILWHLEDMTEGEAREHYLAFYGFGFDFDGSKYNSAKEHFEDCRGQYPPSCFHYLISKGFDVFGLIESGQAIRKMESQPAEAQQQSHD